MAGHEKVYGICENKCMVEVLPKSDFIVLTGEIATVYSGYAATKGITFSELGIKATDKLVVISAMQKTAGYNAQNTNSWSDRVLLDSSKVTYPNADILVTRNDDVDRNKVIIAVANNTTVNPITIEYRVVLLNLH